MPQDRLTKVNVPYHAQFTDIWYKNKNHKQRYITWVIAQIGFSAVFTVKMSIVTNSLQVFYFTLYFAGILEIQLSEV